MNNHSIYKENCLTWSRTLLGLEMFVEDIPQLVLDSRYDEQPWRSPQPPPSPPGWTGAPWSQLGWLLGCELRSTGLSSSPTTALQPHSGLSGAPCRLHS